MIRLVALACGLLCGAGLSISHLYDPAALQALVIPVIPVIPGTPWSPVLGIGLVVAVVVAMVVVALARSSRAPLLGDLTEPTSKGTGRTSLAGALLFGLGWGLAGYFPLAALVSAGVFSPGAVIFLASVLAGMIGSDLITNGGKVGIKGLLSRG